MPPNVSSITIEGISWISTARLTLRPATSEDHVDLHEAFADAEVMRYW
jgi:hypothetical protein